MGGLVGKQMASAEQQTTSSPPQENGVPVMAEPVLETEPRKKKLRRHSDHHPALEFAMAATAAACAVVLSNPVCWYRAMNG